MSNEKQETITDIVAEMREGVVADGWMEQTLREFADRIEAACKHSVPNCNRLGNVAKMREALINAYYAMLKYIKTPYAECDEMAFALDGAIAALATPPRNCDRPECATTKEAQEVWRKEDGGKTAYYEWLLATSTKIVDQRSVNKKLAGELASKDVEIAELHNMIEELTDALHPFREWFGNQKLIDRAKEMIGLKEKGDMT